MAMTKNHRSRPQPLNLFYIRMMSVLEAMGSEFEIFLPQRITTIFLLLPSLFDEIKGLIIRPRSSIG